MDFKPKKDRARKRGGANWHKGANPPVPVKTGGTKQMVTEPRCKVCQHKDRLAIDKLLVKGFSYVEIERLYGVPRRSCSTHADKHLTAESAAIRKIIEEEAREYMDVENTAKAHIISRKGYLETALYQGYQQLMNGTTVVEPRDVVQVIQELMKMDEKAGFEQIDELWGQFNSFKQAMKNVVPQEMFSHIMEEVTRLEEIRTGRVRPDDDTVTGEILDEQKELEQPDQD